MSRDLSSLNPNANWYGNFPNSGLAAGGTQAPQQPRTLDSMAPPTNVQTQTTGQQSPGDLTNFNTAISSLLKQYQQLGTKPFVKQGLDATQAQNDRISAPTSGDFAGANPTLQNAVRSDSAGALDPTIRGAANSAQTFGEQLGSFKDSITSARQLITDYENQQNKSRDDARSVIKDAFTIGGADSLNKLTPDEITKIEKTAGYPKGYIQGVSQTLKEREIAIRQQTASTAGSTKSGNLVYTSADKAEGSKALESSRGNDGWVDPNVYLQMWKRWQAGGGIADDFIKEFPPKLYVNPSNTWLPPFLLPAKVDPLDALIQGALVPK